MRIPDKVKKPQSLFENKVKGRWLMRSNFVVSIFAATLIFFLSGSSPAGASYVELGFYIVENNSSLNEDAEGQFSVIVTNDWTDISGYTHTGDPLDNDEVLFWFTNQGSVTSIISEVYFDDGSLFGINQLVEGDHVDFTTDGTSPPNLPGWNTLDPNFSVTEFFWADTEKDANDGINNSLSPIENGEYLGIIFDLQDGKSYADVITALANPEDTDDGLRIGIHTKSFADGSSASYVNVPVPIPTAALIFGTGLIGLVGIRRRLNRGNKTR